MKKKSSRKLPTPIYYLLAIYYLLYIISTGFPEKSSEISEIFSGFSESEIRKFGKFVRKFGYKFLSIRKFGTFWIPQFRIKSQVGKLLDLYLFIQPLRLSQLGQVRSLPL